MTGHDFERVLDATARFELAATPTALEDLPGLAAALGAPRILVKRDEPDGHGPVTPVATRPVR